MNDTLAELDECAKSYPAAPRVWNAYFWLTINVNGGRAGDYVMISDLIAHFAGTWGADEVIATLNGMCEQGLASARVIYGQQWFILSDSQILSVIGDWP